VVKVGLIGLGAIGRLHFGCWAKSLHGRVAAIASRDPRKRAGEWSAAGFNLGDQAAEHVDLSGVAAYATAEELIADPEVEVVDICTVTPLHAPLAIAALRTGKHVICEKPMSLSREECAAMEEAARVAGRQLMVAHCLRYWPHYVTANEMLKCRALGELRRASLYRVSAMPTWSDGGWLMRPEQSGGVLDLHIHDIDVALWWLGEPDSIEAQVTWQERLPVAIDAQWSYPHRCEVQLTGKWESDPATEFRHGFELICEKGSLHYDLLAAPGVLRVLRPGEATDIPMPEPAAHKAELDEFAVCVAERRPFKRFSPAESWLAVEYGLKELWLAGD
jgi:predicted dehydrogenase